MSDKLRDEICRECKKAIRVSQTSPYEGDEEETGCAASIWTGECTQQFVGWICFECAFAAAMRTEDDEGVRGSIGACGTDWDFCYG